MSDFICLLSTSSDCISAQELTEFVVQGAYFADPVFASPESGRGAVRGRHVVSIRYDSDRRPVDVWHNVHDDLVADEVQQAHEALASSQAPQDVRQRVSVHLSLVTAVVAFEIDAARLSDDAWEMLDSMEAHLARRLNSVIYVVDEGFFDQNLKLLCATSG